ncbi:MAG: OPT family oligopeptide transporter [Planctomycetota bacterium]
MNQHGDDHPTDEQMTAGSAPPVEAPIDDDHEFLYTPKPGERQLTARAVITGCLIGGVVGAMNISLGLKIGWSFGASIIAAILGYAVWHVLRPKQEFGVLETNIAQTAGSATGAMASTAGLLAPIPALGMLENGDAIILSYWQLCLWSLAVGFLGVFFAVPLRRQMVVVEKLRFPTGTATAETIMSIFAEGAEAVRKARVLLVLAIAAAGWVLMVYLMNETGVSDNVPNLLTTSLGWIGLGSVGAFLTAWGFYKITISIALLGGGLLVGPRVGISLLLGAVVGYLVLGYGLVADNAGTHEGAWIVGPGEGEPWTWAAVASSRTGIRGWILWPGVAIMVADALTSLALSWRSILNTFKSTSSGDEDVAAADRPEDSVPNTWWLGGLACGTILAMVIAQFVFQIPWWMTLLSVAMSSLLAAIAVRCTGETDINPVGGMGKVTQLAFGGITQAKGMTGVEAVSTNLMSAAITGAGASQASDMMQDLKTGRMLGAAPRKQIIAQCIGIIAGIPLVCGVYKLFEATQGIGTIESQYGAPAAKAWLAVAEVMSEGIGNLPPGTPQAILAGLALGIALPVIRRFSPKKIAAWVPSGLAFGIAFIVYPYDSVTMFVGSMFLVGWRKLSPKSCAALVFAVASGMLVGEGIMNVLTAMVDLIRGFV